MIINSRLFNRPGNIPGRGILLSQRTRQGSCRKRDRLRRNGIRRRQFNINIRFITFLFQISKGIFQNIHSFIYVKSLLNLLLVKLFRKLCSSSLAHVRKHPLYCFYYWRSDSHYQPFYGCFYCSAWIFQVLYIEMV